MFPHSTCMLFNGKSNNNWKITVIPEDVSLNRQQQVSFLQMIQYITISIVQTKYRFTLQDSL